VIEKPVEYTKHVEVPYERVVERKVQDVHENLVYHDQYLDVDVNQLHHYPNAHVLPTEVVIHEQERIVENPVYYDNIIEKIIDIPREKIIEIPVEKIVQRPIEHIIEKPRYIDNIIERTIEIPVEKVLEKPVEHIVERPVYIDNIIERPVAYEVIKEQVIEKPVEHIVERPVYIDNIIEKRIDVIIENPVAVEQIIEIPVPQYVDHHVQVEEIYPTQTAYVSERPQPVERIRKVPVEYIVHKDNPIAAEDIIEINVPQFQQQTHEKIINKEVLIERVVEVPVAVQQVVEVEVERKIDRAQYVEKLVEVRKPVDAVIEQRYDVIRENIIEVPVEKEIRVSVKTKRAAPVERQNYYESDVYVDSTVVVPVQGTESESNYEVNDADLESRTQHNRADLSAI
jgi:hypothetical protein